MADKYQIAVLEGDGTGPELIKEAVKSIDAITDKYGHSFHLHYSPFGAQAVLDYGTGFPDVTKEVIEQSETVLKGPVGLGPEGMKALQAKGIKLENETILALRSFLDTYANFRPVVLPTEFADFSPLKRERLGNGLDIMMIRELVGGNYFGEKIEGEDTNWQYAVDEGKYTDAQVRRIAKVAFEEAKKRGSQLTNVSKPNIMAEGRLWDRVVGEVAQDYPSVPLVPGIVDAVAYKLITNPSQYNGVMLLENMQGDIITDEGGGVLGSLGLMPSACLNPETGNGYFEPAHGSAPDIAGQGVVNPYAMIGSVAFMLEKGLGLKEEGQAVWGALKKVFGDGYRTKELSRKLDEQQKNQRVGGHMNEFLPVYQELVRNFSGGHQLNPMALQEALSGHFKRKDEALEAKVLSTSQFGDKVKENILAA